MLSAPTKPKPFVPPQVEPSPAFDEAKKQRSGVRETVNFEKVLEESNMAVATQREEDKKALGEGGELKIGENKNDKEFREMLERVSGKKQDKLKNKLDKDDYLNLMVTQLKYQDPTKPLENHEMATQLAQFNTVEQLINVNKSLTDMANKSAQANIDKLTPYLGKVIEVTGAKLRVGSDLKITQGSVELPGSAGSVSVLVKDSTGNTVRTLALGQKDSGRHAIDWDGKTDGGIAAKPGDYTFEVQASSMDGKQMNVKTSFVTKVDAITDLASGGKLETSSGAIESKDILAIRPENSLERKAAKQNEVTAQPQDVKAENKSKANANANSSVNANESASANANTSANVKAQSPNATKPESKKAI